MPTVRTDDGVELYYEEHGAGLPLVLAYGLGGNTQVWEPQIADFSRKYRLILWDKRGHGRSESPVLREQYGMERSAADLRALLDHLGIDRAYVGGLSMGAGVSTRFTLRYLERVAALLIIDSQSASGIPLTPAMRAMREKSIQLLEAGRGLPIADFAVLVHGEADAVEQVRQMYEAMNPVGFANTLRATLVADSITGKLAQIRVPTLIVVGEADEALGPSRATHERIAGSKLVVIPKARHLSNLDQPELFNRTVLEFLADVDRRRAGFG